MTRTILFAMNACGRSIRVAARELRVARRFAGESVAPLLDDVLERLAVVDEICDAAIAADSDQTDITEEIDAREET